MRASWESIVASTRIGGALPMRLSITHGDLHELCNDEILVMIMEVPCIKTGKPLMISRRVPLPVFETRELAEMFIRKQVHWMYRHEADEQLWIGGRRPFDPVEDHQ